MTRILVLEDNPNLLRLYGRILAKSGYQVEMVNTISDAETCLTQNQYDVFISDMQIGDKPALPLLQAWLEQLHKAGTKVIVLSGRMEYYRGCQEMGVDLFLIKPMMSDMLRTAVAHLLEGEVDHTRIPGLIRPAHT